MYTWGYIKENTLSKLNLTEESANQQNFLSRFPYYANEAMTQICSGIKPREVYMEIEVLDKQKTWAELTHKYGVYCDCPEHVNAKPDPSEDLYETKMAFWKEWNSLYFKDEPVTMPTDFISFSDDIVLYKGNPLYVRGQMVHVPEYIEVGDEYIHYYGYNQVVCKELGKYRVPYHARWFFFTKELQNDVTITAPDDVCDAIPSYIASQCLKIDDEAKAAIYRNEYEMFLARLDDSSFVTQRTLHIGGGW